MLPIQFCWAAAAAYCGHEDGGAAKHFGHHDHRHGAASDDGVSKDTRASPALADNDCSTCHLNVAQPLAPAANDLSAPGTEPPRGGWSAAYDSHIPSGPERPDRPAPTPAVRIGGAVVIGACTAA